MPWITGPDVNPFAGGDQGIIDLLESVSPAQLASCVPVIKIVQVDPRTGRPVQSQRPLMFDLTAGAQFGAAGGDGFGSDRDAFLDRALVSLKSLKVDTHLSYGLLTFREITLEFTVHRPDLVFNRFTTSPWRALLEAGNSFSLEYGWSADPTLVPNELYNGYGTVASSGKVIRATQTLLLVPYTYRLRVRQTGEVDVTLMAMENGDIALREARFSDTFDKAYPDSVPPSPDSDKANAQRLKALLGQIPFRTAKNRGDYVTLGDVLNAVAPILVAAGQNMGYVDVGKTQEVRSVALPRDSVTPVPPSPVQLFLGNFNKNQGRPLLQSPKYGGGDMAGQSIGSLVIPLSVLRDQFTRYFQVGRAMTLQNFLLTVIGMANSVEAWGGPGQGVTTAPRKPVINLKSDTISKEDGSTQLILSVFDRTALTDAFVNSDFLPLSSQTKANVQSTLRARNVPFLEFGRASSVILEANFEIQTDPLLQSIQVEGAYRESKDRQEQTQTPDVESRRRKAGPREIIPASILEGEITMLGNFVLESFALIWVEFFGASSISGVFHALEKTDTIEPGRFVSQVKIISEGLDPLNTRKQLGGGVDTVSGA